MAGPTLVTNGVTIKELYDGGYATTTVEPDDLVLMIRNGSEVVIKAKDLLKSDWMAAPDAIGHIKNKPTDLVTLDGVQDLSNKTFRNSKAYTYPTYDIPNTLPIDISNKMDGDLNLSFTTTVNATIRMPPVIDGAIIVFRLFLSTNGSYSFYPPTAGGTISWGESPAEFVAGKLHIFTAVGSGTTWYITQGKTF